MFLPCLVSRPHYFGRPIYILSGYHGCKSPHKVSYRQGCISQLIQQIQGGITPSPTQCSITSDRSATPGKASIIAQPERKPCIDLSPSSPPVIDPRWSRHPLNVGIGLYRTSNELNLLPFQHLFLSSWKDRRSFQDFYEHQETYFVTFC